MEVVNVLEQVNPLLVPILSGQLNLKTPGFWGDVSFGCWSIGTTILFYVLIILIVIVIHYIYIYQNCIDFMKWDSEVFYGLTINVQRCFDGNSADRLGLTFVKGC